MVRVEGASTVQQLLDTLWQQHGGEAVFGSQNSLRVLMHSRRLRPDEKWDTLCPAGRSELRVHLVRSQFKAPAAAAAASSSSSSLQAQMESPVTTETQRQGQRQSQEQEEASNLPISVRERDGGGENGAQAMSQWQQVLETASFPNMWQLSPSNQAELCSWMVQMTSVGSFE